MDSIERIVERLQEMVRELAADKHRLESALAAARGEIQKHERHMVIIETNLATYIDHAVDANKRAEQAEQTRDAAREDSAKVAELRKSVPHTMSLLDRARNAERERDDAREEAEQARKDRQHWIDEYEKQHEHATDAAHVIVQSGIGHEDLSVCGCQCCENVRKGMIKAGYLPQRGEGR